MRPEHNTHIRFNRMGIIGAVLLWILIVLVIIFISVMAMSVQVTITHTDNICEKYKETKTSDLPAKCLEYYE